MRSIFVSLLAFVLGIISPAAYAYTDLLGPDAVLVPYVDLPFTTSTVVKNTGERLPDGACRFPVNIELPPGMLQDNEVFVRVRRAFDPVMCEETLEQGIALKPLPEFAQPTSDDLVQEVIDVIGLSSSSSVSTTSSGSLSQEATGYIRYTDGQNPYMQPFVENLPFWDGITASEVYASISGEWSDSRACPSPYTSWGYYEGTDYSPFWDEVDTDWDYIYVDCESFEINVNVKHTTDAKVDAVDIDCSEGASIEYKPMRFRLERSGAKIIDSAGVIESGPIPKCREYLVRTEVFE